MSAPLSNPRGPPTADQLRALNGFGAKMPKGLDKELACDWIDLLVRRLKSGEKITDEDLAGPPVAPAGFTPASQLPLPLKTPEPASSPIIATASGPLPAPMPSPESWVTYERETITKEGPFRVKVRQYAKIADHPLPGETFKKTLARLRRDVLASLEGQDVSGY